MSTASADRPEIQAFTRFYLEHAATLAAEVGYVALPERAYELGWAAYTARKSGSIFNTELAKSGKHNIVDLMGM